jgi:hypothetical protein
MSQLAKQINRMIFLTGIKSCGYTVFTGGFDGLLPLEVPTVRVGNAIVRALREEAAKRPDFFTPAARYLVKNGAKRHLSVNEAYRLYEETGDERLRSGHLSVNEAYRLYEETGDERLRTVF